MQKNAKKIAFFKKPITKQFICLVLVFIAFSAATELMAEAAGPGAIDALATEIKKYFKSVSNLLYVIVSIIGLVGLIMCIHKFMSGDPNATKVAAGWIAGILVAVLGVFFLQKMFGI
jgi:TRAP-type C4-dicarboxylate transport system permease small subunit